MGRPGRRAERSLLLSRAGAPAVGVRIAVDDEGEVLAQSNHVFAGYWEQPAESAAALEGGWFHTGDGGYLDGAYLVISDRKKDVIITGGENVSSIEVEDCLYQHAAVAEVAVIGVPDEKWGETIKALVVVRPGETVDRGRAHRALPRPHGPLQGAPTVESATALDRTATGKLQKYKLRQPYWAGRESRSTSAGYVCPAAGSPRRRAPGGRGALLEHQAAPPVEGRRHLAADEPAQRVAHDGTPPALVEPAVLAAEQLGDVGPGGQQGLVEIEIVGDLAHHARAHGHGCRRRRRVPPLGRHADLFGWQLEAACDGARGFRPARPCARWRPSTPRVRRSSSPLRGRPLRDGLQPQVREHHAPRPVASPPPCAHARPRPPGPRRGERRDMLRMSPSLHQASSGHARRRPVDRAPGRIRRAPTRAGRARGAAR